MPSPISREFRAIIWHLRVIGGVVRCPLRGYVDIEVCFYCPRLLAVDLDSPMHSIRCAVSRRHWRRQISSKVRQ
jgi:hypothetical protein